MDGHAREYLFIWVVSLDHPDYSVYDCCLPRTSGHFLYKKKFTQSEAYPDMDIIADWLIWIVVNIQWEFEIKLKFDWLSLSNKYLYCFVEGRRTQKHQELRLKAVLRAYFIADRPWHFFENIKTIGGSKNCIWGGVGFRSFCRGVIWMYSITIHLKLLYRDDYYTDINFDRWPTVDLSWPILM